VNGFDRALALVLGEEGGLSNHPKDPGGRTNLGITQATLDSARITLGNLPTAVDDLTRDQAESIYLSLYWNQARCQYLPDGPALFVFDSAVQHSPAQSIKFLQRGLGVADDGVFGTETKRVVAQIADWPLVLREMAARRAFSYMQLHNTNDTFGLGWARRLIRVYDAARGML
jgi:lysozyme family protein